MWTVLAGRERTLGREQVVLNQAVGRDVASNVANEKRQRLSGASSFFCSLRNVEISRALPHRRLLASLEVVEHPKCQTFPLRSRLGVPTELVG